MMKGTIWTKTENQAAAAAAATAAAPPANTTATTTGRRHRNNHLGSILAISDHLSTHSHSWTQEALAMSDSDSMPSLVSSPDQDQGKDNGKSKAQGG